MIIESGWGSFTGVAQHQNSSKVYSFGNNFEVKKKFAIKNQNKQTDENII